MVRALRFPRGLAALLFLLVAVQGGDVHADAPPSIPGAQPPGILATALSTVTPGAFARLSGDLGSGHALFVDDGNCPGNIDVYRIGTSLQLAAVIPTGACNDRAYFGANSLATTQPSSTQPACLIQTDFEHGYILSFVIDLSRNLFRQVGRAPASVPTDVKISADGSTVFVSELTNGLETFGLSSACALTGPLSHAGPPRPLGTYISSAVVDPTHIAVPDTQNSVIDVYTVGGGATLLLQSSTPSAIPGPDSIVGTGGLPSGVITGSATRGAPFVQADRLTGSSGALLPIAGSPASDLSGIGGAAVWLDRTDSLVIQGEQYTNSLAVYSIVQSQGLALLQHVPLAATTLEWPSLFQQLGSVLFVNDMINGDIEACRLSSAGISSCLTVAVLPNPAVSQGMTVL